MTPLEKEILGWLYQHQASADKAVEFFTNFISQKAFPCTDQEVSSTLKSLEQRNFINLTYYQNGEIDVVKDITQRGLTFYFNMIARELRW